MAKNWKFAILCQEGIYQGELIGEQEPHETSEQCLRIVSKVVREFIPVVTSSPIIASFASESPIYIEAEGTTLIDIGIQAQVERRV